MGHNVVNFEGPMSFRGTSNQLEFVGCHSPWVLGSSGVEQDIGPMFGSFQNGERPAVLGLQL